MGTKSLKKCPVTVNDTANANSIRGPVNRDKLKGEVMRPPPNCMFGVEGRVEIPRY